MTNRTNFKNDKITEKNIRIEVTNFTAEYGYENTDKMALIKQKNKKAEILYPAIQTLVLTQKQESLLLKFIDSL